MLNAFGIFGYYAAWSAHEDFPLAALLRLTGKIKLNWEGDNCFTDLSKELACLSSYIEKLQIKEETHYDECKLYCEAWQLQCSEDWFAVGDKVDWTCVMPAEYKNAHGIIIDFEEEHHGFAKYSISGIVAQIIAERSEFPKGERVVSYAQAKTIQEEILRADGHERILAMTKKLIELLGIHCYPQRCSGETLVGKGMQYLSNRGALLWIKTFIPYYCRVFSDTCFTTYFFVF